MKQTKVSVAGKVLIHGLSLTHPPRYAAGHVCNEAEASALNQVIIASISNTARPKIRVLLKNLNLPCPVVSPSDEVIAEAQSILSSIGSKYFIGKTPQTDRKPLSPVERLSRQLAAEAWDKENPSPSTKEEKRARLDAIRQIASRPDMLEFAATILRGREKAAAAKEAK